MANFFFRKVAKACRRPSARRTTACLCCLFALWLSACQPGITPAALPTPNVMSIQVTPALQSLGANFNTCTSALENTGLVTLNTPANAIDLNKTALALRWGPPANDDSYAAVIGEEELLIIISSKNPIAEITAAVLASIYRGDLRTWPSSEAEIQPWVYPTGDDSTDIFNTAVLEGKPASNKVVYTAPDPAAMLEAVAENANAIGFIPRRWLNDSVKVLPVEGQTAAQMRQPVVALSKSEPTGPEKSWLLCLQEQLKK